MKKFTYLKICLALSMLVLLMADAFSQSGTASSGVIVVPTSATNVTLTGTPTSSRRFLTSGTGTTWTFLSGPQTITVGSTTVGGSNNDPATATASFPIGALPGTYTFRLNYTQTVNQNNANNPTTGNLSVTVNVVPLPAPIGCDGQFYISHTTGTTGPNGNTLVKKLTFNAGILTPTAFTLEDGQPATTIGFNGMGLNPKDGYMYAARYPVTSPSAPPRLILIGQPGQGVVNQIDLGPIAGLSNGASILAATFDKDGNYYFTSGEGLYRILAANLQGSRQATQIGSNNSNYSSFADLAINPVTNVMYATSTATSGNYLYTISYSSAPFGPTAVSSNVSRSGFFAGLFFDEVGNLYGYRSTGDLNKIDKTNGALSNAGSSSNYDGADGCSCSFGRVFHDLGGPLVLCPLGTGESLKPKFIVTVDVTNQASDLQQGLTYTLDIPSSRFSFTETPAVIAQRLATAGLIPTNTPSFVTISSSGPGTNNKIVVTSFQTGLKNTTKSFTLELQLVDNTTPYEASVDLQSKITGINPLLGIGTEDLSNNPATISADDPLTIAFCPQASLPVRLLSFSGTLNNNATYLKWQVEGQDKFDYYEVERSTDARNFGHCTIKQATTETGRVSYQFTDDLSQPDAIGNVFYYRLKMVDLDGSFKYSNVIMIRRDQKTITGLLISPNPVSNNADIATIRLSASGNSNATVRVFDMTGRAMVQQQNQLTEGVNSISINGLNRLQSGTYMVQVIIGDEILNSKLSIVR